MMSRAALYLRSGAKDFATWIMGDLFGGAFFHLLLGAVLAAVLGGVAGILRFCQNRFLWNASTSS